MKPCGVLITRPEPGTAQTAAAVAERGWQPVLAPALVLRPMALRAGPAQAVLLTSRAAARLLPGLGLPVLAVGDATAQEARAAGHLQVTAADGDAQSLLALAVARLDPAAGPLLLAVGQGYAMELAAGLRLAGFTVHRRLAYCAAAATQLPDAALDALRAGLVGQGLFLSPRSAACGISMLRKAGLVEVAASIRAIAISDRVARVLAALPWATLEVASRPDHDAMIETLGLPT